MEDAQRRRKLALRVGQHRVRQALQTGMVVAPCQVDEMRVRACAQDLRVAVDEVLVALAKLGNLCRADEREIHRPEKDYLPLALVRALGDLLKLLLLLQTNYCIQLETRKFLSNCQHLTSPITVLNLELI